jgi:hypothetical protein
VVAKELNAHLGTQAIYSDHQDWDSFWCHRLFETVGLGQKFGVFDITALMGGKQLDSFILTLEELSNSTSKGFCAHRALNDARVVHQAVILALKR